MIPKIIHYCWFGKNPKPQLFKKCLKSWKKHCPDYEIIEWNEDNFDIESNLYTKQAYDSKKWAFVTDYVRLYVLYHHGGIYMDADVEVIKPLDRFLKHEAFSGFENPSSIPTGIMASEKGNGIIKYLLDYYNERPFLIDGKADLTTNVKVITNLLSSEGFKPNNQYQVIHGFALYPFDFFCPQDYLTGQLTQTDNTYTIHHFAGSWLPKKEQQKIEFKHRLRRINNLFGERIANFYESYYYSKKVNGGIGSLEFFKRVLKRKIKKLSAYLN